MDIVHRSNIVFGNGCFLLLILIDTDSSDIVQLPKMLRYSILASDQVLDFKRIKLLHLLLLWIASRENWIEKNMTTWQDLDFSCWLIPIIKCYRMSRLDQKNKLLVKTLITWTELRWFEFCGSSILTMMDYLHLYFDIRPTKTMQVAAKNRRVMKI